jgi:hypothetical protein
VNQFFFCNYSYAVHTEYIYFFFINWTLRMSDNLPERVQILCHVHIICITVLENRIICCQIFCDLLLKSAFEWIFNVMQLILVKIKWHIKWKYLIQKFYDICLSYYKIYFKYCILHLYHLKYLFSVSNWWNKKCCQKVTWTEVRWDKKWSHTCCIKNTHESVIFGLHSFNLIINL